MAVSNKGTMSLKMMADEIEREEEGDEAAWLSGEALMLDEDIIERIGDV